MEIEEIIKDIDNVDLTNNRALDEILEIEYFLRECIRHNLSLILNDGSNQLTKQLNMHIKDSNSLFENAILRTFWEMEGDGTIWFEVDFTGSTDTIDFDDMPIEILTEVIKHFE